MGASKDEKSKHKKHKKKERKEKHKKKDGKRGKERSSRRGSDSSASSDGGGARVSAAAQVAQGRVAVRAAREILAYNYELRNDLREVRPQTLEGAAASSVFCSLLAPPDRRRFRSCSLL
jgi:outer membrane biosynthesis protein TonB